LDRPGEHLRRLEELSPAVDVDVLRTDGVGADQASLDELVRVPPDELAVLERARLRLVRVADEVMRLAGILRHERPLHARRESRPAPPAEARLLYGVDHLVGGHTERLAQRGVAAALHVGLEAALRRVAEMLADDADLAVRNIGIGHLSVTLALQMREDLRDLCGRNVLEVLRVDLDARGKAAAREALRLNDGEVPGPRGLAELRPRVLEEGREHVVRAAQVAGDVGAYLDEMAADGSLVVHRVEGRDPTDVGRRQVEEL